MPNHNEIELNIEEIRFSVIEGIQKQKIGKLCGLKIDNIPLNDQELHPTPEKDKERNKEEMKEDGGIDMSIK